MSPWYSGSSQPLYLALICEDPSLHRFQIMLEPDLSTASLHFISTSETNPPDFDNLCFEDYMICEDILVSCGFYDNQDDPYQYQCGEYKGLKSTRFAVISHGGPGAKIILPGIGNEYRLFSCPVSGRFVLLDSSNSVVVLDIF